jgi:hypothetical protein
MSAGGHRQPTPRCEVSSATYGWTLLRSSNGLQIPTLPKTLSFGSATVLRRKPNESAVKLGSIWLAAPLRVPEGILGALVEFGGRFCKAPPQALFCDTWVLDTL